MFLLMIMKMQKFFMINIEELQTKLSELINLRDYYLKIARNDEVLNDEIRAIQKIIYEHK
jgi:hypothetical protein